VRAELGINQDVYVGQGKLLTMIIAIPWITGVTLYWVLVVPRRCLQKIKWTFSRGVLSIKVKWSMFPFLSIALCFALW
jgi:hypothetical protein